MNPPPPPPAPAVTAIVLAAGEGTRMKSRRLPKVLHGFAGRSLLQHVLAAVEATEPTRTLVVVGHRRDEVVEHLSAAAPAAEAVVQDEQRGTGHAVQIAVEQAPAAADEIVLVVPGDAPLLTGETLLGLVREHAASGAAATMLTAVVADPTGYGRVIRRGALVVRVVEHADATASEREIAEVAASVYAFDAGRLRWALQRLDPDNAQGELYLPDAVAILVGDGLDVRALRTTAEEISGVNSRSQLAAAHHAYNARLLRGHMDNGVTIVDPASTWVDASVLIDADVTLRPGVELFGVTTIAGGATIGPDVSLTDTTVGEDSRISRAVCVEAEVGARCEIGPFAYLRPGSKLADAVKIGTYVEVKGSDIGTGTKVPHLSYVGDADIGEHTNIGAASVFVNYDGVSKHRSVIGDHARTGADNMFVAPVQVGDGAYTAAGSVITEDVPAGALAVGRARQRNVEGWVARQRPGTKAAAAAAASASRNALGSLAESLEDGSDRTPESAPTRMDEQS